MQRFLKSSATALVSGGLSFLSAIWYLMDLGLRQYDNYEYYGGYWWIYCGAGVIGWFAPSVLAWILRSARKRK